jgi:hypothetical protein
VAPKELFNFLFNWIKISFLTDKLQSFFGLLRNKTMALKTSVYYEELPSGGWSWKIKRGRLTCSPQEEFSDKRSAKRNFYSVAKALKGDVTEIIVEDPKETHSE